MTKNLRRLALAATLAAAILAGFAFSASPASAKNCTGTTAQIPGHGVKVDFSCDFTNPSGSFDVILSKPVSDHEGFEPFACGVPSEWNGYGERDSHLRRLVCTKPLPDDWPGKPGQYDRNTIREIAPGMPFSGTVWASDGWDCARDPLTVTLKYWERIEGSYVDPETGVRDTNSSPLYFPLPGPCGKPAIAGNTQVLVPAKQTSKALGAEIQCFGRCELKVVSTIKLPKGLGKSAPKQLALGAKRTLAKGGRTFVSLKPKPKQAKLLKKALKRKPKLPATFRVTGTDAEGKKSSVSRKLTVRR